MGSTEYDIMNFYANWNDPGGKNIVPRKKSVPMSDNKRFPIQNSLNHPRGKPLGISHYWSISTCVEIEDEKVIDARKKK